MAAQAAPAAPALLPVGAPNRPIPATPGHLAKTAQARNYERWLDYHKARTVPNPSDIHLHGRVVSYQNARVKREWYNVPDYAWFDTFDTFLVSGNDKNVRIGMFSTTMAAPGNELEETQCHAWCGVVIKTSANRRALIIYDTEVDIAYDESGRLKRRQEILVKAMRDLADKINSKSLEIWINPPSHFKGREECVHRTGQWIKWFIEATGNGDGRLVENDTRIAGFVKVTRK